MNEVSALQKRYCSRALTLAILAWVVMMVLDMQPIGKGIILGTLFSILNFVLMGLALPGVVARSAKGGVIRSLGSVMTRYLFMAAALFIGIKWDAVNVFAVAGGLFAVQITILGDHVFFQGRRE